MPKRRSITSCVEEIRSINRRFRQLKNKDGPTAQRLCQEKDALIDEMIALCHHPSVIAMGGVAARGGRPPVAARRFCTRCGHCESEGRDGSFGALANAVALRLSLDDYLLRQGLVLQRLGINI